jgi:hypothetical protein
MADEQAASRPASCCQPIQGKRLENCRPTNEAQSQSTENLEEQMTCHLTKRRELRDAAAQVDRFSWKSRKKRIMTLSAVPPDIPKSEKPIPTSRKKQMIKWTCKLSTSWVPYVPAIRYLWTHQRGTVLLLWAEFQLLTYIAGLDSGSF